MSYNYRATTLQIGHVQRQVTDNVGRLEPKQSLWAGKSVKGCLIWVIQWHGHKHEHKPTANYQHRCTQQVVLFQTIVSSEALSDFNSLQLTQAEEANFDFISEM